LRAELERGISRAWEGLTEGWRELLTRSSGALTQFARPAKERKSAGVAKEFPQWALLAGEVWETAHAVIVRLELPGLKREDIDVSIDRGSLRIRGEKRSAGRPQGRTYHLMERAFGRFERTIALPHNIDTARAELAYEDGVLTVIVPKTEPTPPTRLSVT
jgi:HSP20 family protein